MKSSAVPSRPVDPAGAPSLRWFGWTDRGRVRPHNEDSYLGLRFDAGEVQHLGRLGEGGLAAMDYAFAVSDGMGGALAGELASRIAVEKITALLPRSFQQSAQGMSTGFSDILDELFSRIHGSLKYVGDSYAECAGMETTLSLAWFTPGWLYFGHIGDSRIYRLAGKGGALQQLTHDDTHVGWLYRNGQINEREARNHPRRHVLQKALGGSNQFVDPQTGAVAIEAGDTFLLCTDGLVDGLHDGALADLLALPDGDDEASPARRLVEEAVRRSGRDNTTAVVVRVT